MQKPRLLLLSQTLPFPPDEGVKIRAYHTLRILGSLFEIDALCFYRARTLVAPDGVQRAVQALSAHGSIRAFPIPQEGNRFRWVTDHAMSVLQRKSYVLSAYNSSDFRSALNRQLDTRSYDLVHLESLDLAGHLRALAGLPVVCTHHNIESALLRDRSSRAASPLVRRYLRLQANWTEELERSLAPRFAVNIAVSNADAARLRSLAPTAHVEVVPNGVDTTYFRPAEPMGRRGAVFVGGTSWYPNRDALSYYVRDIAPRLATLLGSTVPVTWVGNATPGERATFEGVEGVTLTGYVEDIRPYVHGALCYIVPLRVGGGTRLKILDAWAMGLPVVSTSRGAEGLETQHGKNILIADSPDEFAAAMSHVLLDPSARERLGEAGRQTAVEHYAWDRLSSVLARIYSRAVAS